MANNPRPPRRRTKETVEPEDYDDDADIADEDEDDDAEATVTTMPANRASRRRRQRRSERSDRYRKSRGIQIEANSRNDIPVRLVGEDYVISPPKTSKFLRLAAEAETGMLTASDNIAQVEDWVLEAFGEDIGNDVLDRLDDDDDDLDLPHIQKLMQQVMQHVSKNPTT